MLFKKRIRPRRTKEGFFRKLAVFLLPNWSLSHEAKRAVFFIFFLVAGFVCLFGYLGNAGSFGEVVNVVLEAFFGQAKWSLPVLIFLSLITIARDEEDKFDSANIFGLFLFLISISSFLYFWEPVNGGGMVGGLISPYLILYLGTFVSALILVSLLIVSLVLIFNTSISKIIGEESFVFKLLMLILGILFSPFIGKDKEEFEEDDFENNENVEVEKNEAVVKEYEIEDDDEDGQNVKKNKKSILMLSDKHEEKGKGFIWSKSNIKINLPFDLLKSKPQKPTSGNIDKNQDIIKQTLLDFGIPISMGSVTIGPTVTQYTFKPANGISVSRIRALSDDLALSLAVDTLRVEAPIPGKALVGLEVPNQTKVLVSLKEVLKSKIFKERKSNTTIPLGRDVTGKVWTDELVKMPHILIAGATRSGKSIFLHSFITSLLFQNNPDDLKFIMIDQKQVELSMYNGIPYLISPVITDHKKAVKALAWCVGEMDRRLDVINSCGGQNIEDYNKRKSLDKLPYLVVVVDELGDLLSMSKKEAEGAIIRLGQKARAAGIHLVLATQRPSVDILSGLIKANMPARAAFSVTSSINSKTILDFVGAEKLLGEGDMLYINSAMSKPVRIQGAFIDKDEVKEVVRYIKGKVGKAEYQEEFEVKEQTSFDFDDEDYEGDVMLEEAEKLILDAGKASATMLQSRLGIGYPRANRILDNLEKKGVVGPSIQNKPREVYSGG